MDYMYAPWRGEYINNKEKGCPFCNIVNNSSKDEEHHVLYRTKNCFLVMNKYPYNPGHLMVVPNLHKDSIEDLSSEVWLEMSTLVQKTVKLLKEKLGANGVNIGMNLGECAGASIAEHVHFHIVPRWRKDTNFITTIASTRVYSTDFEKLYIKLRDLFLHVE
ncbi:MAG: HIT domain-containing protein [Sulfurospirillum sp.]|nr:HIT domain-containing protein [Sulfurospirillum sp.]